MSSISTLMAGPLLVTAFMVTLSPRSPDTGLLSSRLPPRGSSTPRPRSWRAGGRYHYGTTALVAEDLREILRLLAHLVVQLVAQDGYLAVDLLARAHDVAQRPVLLRDPPGRHRGGVHSREVVLPADVLLRQAQLGDSDEWRERLRPDHRHVLDRHVLQIDAELDLDVELVRALLQLRHQRRAEDLPRGGEVEGPPRHAVGILLRRRHAHLGDVVAVAHGGHRPKGGEEQVDRLDLLETQESTQLVPHPFLRGERASARDPGVEEVVEASPLLFVRFPGRRRDADFQEQLLDDHVLLDRVAEEDRGVDIRVVEGAAIRLVLEQRRAGDTEELQPHAADRPSSASGPVWADPLEKRTIASWRPGVA